MSGRRKAPPADRPVQNLVRLSASAAFSSPFSPCSRPPLALLRAACCCVGENEERARSGRGGGKGCARRFGRQVRRGILAGLDPPLPRHGGTLPPLASCPPLAAAVTLAAAATLGLLATYAVFQGGGGA